MKSKKTMALLLAVFMLMSLISPAFAAGETVSTSMNGNDVTITISDGQSAVVSYAKNTTQIYDVGGYKVSIEYNGSGVKAAKIVGYPSAAPAPEGNAPEPKPGVSLDGTRILTWNEFDADAATTALPPAEVRLSARTDSSGDKIPSNAHSGDFPGIYFYWNDKQKADGFLKVDPEVFDLFVDGEFYITAQNSSTYYDWIILKEAAYELSDTGDYLYRIPKQAQINGKVTEIKNINQIFIGGNYKPAYFDIEKFWFDEDGNPITDQTEIDNLNALLKFNGYHLGENEVKITRFTDAAKGKKITVTETAPAGYLEKNGKASQNVIVKWDLHPTLTFENQKQLAYLDIVKVWKLQDWDGSVTTIPDIVAWAAALDASLTAPQALFTNGYTLGTSMFPEGQITFSEEEDFGVVLDAVGLYYSDGLYTYEIQFKCVDYPGVGADDKKINLVDFIAAAGQNYTVTFTNVIIKTKVYDEPVIELEKVWIDEDGNTIAVGDLPAGVSESFEDGDGTPRVSGEIWIADLGSVSITETYDPGPIVVDTLTNVYVELIKVEVNGTTAAFPGDTVTFNAEPNEVYHVVFTNQVTIEVLPGPPTLEIEKEWVDVYGNPVTNADLLDELMSKLSFTNGYTYGGPDEITAGAVSFQENQINEFTFNGVTYTVTFESVTYDGGTSNTNAVSFTAVDGEDYVVTFVNVVDTIPYDTGDDFIASKEHFDRWWNYGVLCYSSSTGTDTDYFVAFDADFWNRNEYALIGFGNNETSIDYEAYFDKDGWSILQTSTNTIINSGTYQDPFFVPQDLWNGHYFAGGASYWGGYNGPALIGTASDLGAYFANVFGSGGRQAYRLTIKPLI